MLKLHKIVRLLLVLFSVLQMSCKDDPPVIPPIDPPIYTQNIFLSVADSSLTEIQLNLSISDSLSPRGFSIYRNNAQILSGSLFGRETVLVDTAVQFNTSYVYTAFRTENSIKRDSSKSVMITTLDTTSHNYTFTFDTLGDGASSSLYDVAIINDTLAFAVGEIFLKDSTGNIDSRRYNIGIWNGKTWKILRLFHTGSPPVIRSICAINETDVWLDPWIHWDGITFQAIPVDPIFIGVGINKMWGNSDVMYAVGYNGFIARKTTSGWQKIESGTDVNINDVWGDRTGSNVIAAATNIFSSGERKLLRINSTTTEALNWSPQQRLHSIWFTTMTKLFTSGGGVYVFSKGTWKEIPLPALYTKRIRGTQENNIWTVGDFGIGAHFNGVSWKVFSEIALPDGLYAGLAVTSKMMLAVGQVGNRAVIVTAKAN